MHRNDSASVFWFNYISSNVFLTHSLTFFLNAGRSSLHMIDASMFAAESQFGSLNIERTERRIVSKAKTKINKRIVPLLTTDRRSELASNVLLLIHIRIDRRQVRVTKTKFSLIALPRRNVFRVRSICKRHRSFRCSDAKFQR